MSFTLFMAIDLALLVLLLIWAAYMAFNRPGREPDREPDWQWPPPRRSCWHRHIHTTTEEDR